MRLGEGRERDPVCGMKVEPGGPGGSATHRERTYYFCNPVCRETFVQNPEKYVK